MYFSEEESFRWGYEKPVQKQPGTHMLEKIACNQLEVDENIYLGPSAIINIVQDIVALIIQDSAFQNYIRNEITQSETRVTTDIEYKIGTDIDTIVDKVIDKLVKHPEDPAIEALVEAVRRKQCSRFDEVVEKSEDPPPSHGAATYDDDVPF
jgi:hypothetical protein